MDSDATGEPTPNRGPMVAAAAIALLALFATAEAIDLNARYDYRFALAALGVAGAGAGLGAALGEWLRRSFQRGRPLALPLAAAGAAATWIAHLFLPTAAPLACFTLLLLPALPAAGVGATLAARNEGEGRSGGHAPVAAAAGTAAATAITTYAGGPLVASLTAAAGLALLALASRPGRGARWLAQGTLGGLVLACLATGYHLSPPPRWTTGHGAKPLYRDLAVGEAKAVAHRWLGASRLDLFTAPWSGGHLLGSAIDGLPLLPAPAAAPDPTERLWLQTHFPLLTLGLEATRPRRLLIVSPGGGVAPRLARDLGVPAVVVAPPTRLARRALAATRNRPGDPLADAGVTVSFAPLLRYLALDPTPFDAILLTLPAEEGGWLDRDPAAGGPFTAEALAAYWRHLTPDGHLLVVTGDGALFGRALLTAWEQWQTMTGEARPLVAHAAGVRLLSLGARLPLLQYLALIRRDGGVGDLGERLDAALAATRGRGLGPDTSLAPLFGPTTAAKPPYHALATADVGAARPALFQAFSWHAQTALDLRAATADRPLFFQIAHDLPGPLKALLLVALVALAALLLMPAPEVRRVDHPTAAALPPLPLLLATSGIATAAPAAGIIALALLAAPAAGTLSYTAAAAAAGAAAGIGLAARRESHTAWSRWGAAAVAYNLALAAACATLAPLLLAAPPPAALLAVATVALATTHLAARQLHADTTVLAKRLPALAPWRPAVATTALLTVAVATPWVVQLHGITSVWLAAAAAQLVTAATAAWWLPRGRG